MSNIFLETIWNKAEKLIRAATHVVFCGYSLPDADMHIKYLLKRSQNNRNNLPIKFSVINNFTGKRDWIKDDEINRYKRFFGTSVNYLNDVSFEDFAEDPGQYL